MLGPAKLKISSDHWKSVRYVLENDEGMSGRCQEIARREVIGRGSNRVAYVATDADQFVVFGVDPYDDVTVTAIGFQVSATS